MASEEFLAKTAFTALKNEIEKARDDAENHAQSLTSFTDVNSDPFDKGARGWSEDAEDFADISIGSANFKGDWADLTGALNVPATVRHDSTIWLLINDLADVTTSEPSEGNADWDALRITRVTNSPPFNVDSISDLIALNTGTYTKAVVSGFYSDTPWGFTRLFEWDSTQDQSNHDGWSIINPDHLSTIGSAGWYSSTGDATDDSGTGCWVRGVGGVIYVLEMGIKTDGTEGSAKIEAVINAIEAGKTVAIDTDLTIGEIPITISSSRKIEIRKGITITMSGVTTNSTDTLVGRTYRSLFRITADDVEIQNEGKIVGDQGSGNDYLAGILVKGSSGSEVTGFKYTGGQFDTVFDGVFMYYADDWEVKNLTVKNPNASRRNCALNIAHCDNFFADNIKSYSYEETIDNNRDATNGKIGYVFGDTVDQSVLELNNAQNIHVDFVDAYNCQAVEIYDYATGGGGDDATINSDNIWIENIRATLDSNLSGATKVIFNPQATNEGTRRVVVNNFELYESGVSGTGVTVRAMILPQNNILVNNVKINAESICPQIRFNDGHDGCEVRNIWARLTPASGDIFIYSESFSTDRLFLSYKRIESTNGEGIVFDLLDGVGTVQYLGTESYINDSWDQANGLFGFSVEDRPIRLQQYISFLPYLVLENSMLVTTAATNPYAGQNNGYGGDGQIIYDKTNIQYVMVDDGLFDMTKSAYSNDPN